MSFISFSNRRIYYNEIGTGSPLLLLHGNTASSSMFAQITEKYASDFKVILFDFLGHGKSDRLHEFPADLWFNEAEQVIAFLREKQYSAVNLIGSSGGALVAINVALEAPELVNRVIADSFEGEKPVKAFIERVKMERENSKCDQNIRMFYASMHGSDWEQVVDNDTSAIIRHEKEIGTYFHKNLQSLKPEILLTASKEDEFICAAAPDSLEKFYGELISKIGHGEIHLFDTGVHPAMLSNPDEFYHMSVAFLTR